MCSFLCNVSNTVFAARCVQITVRLFLDSLFVAGCAQMTVRLFLESLFVTRCAQITVCLFLDSVFVTRCVQITVCLFLDSLFVARCAQITVRLFLDSLFAAGWTGQCEHSASAMTVSWSRRRLRILSSTSQKCKQVAVRVCHWEVTVTPSKQHVLGRLNLNVQFDLWID